MKHQAPESEFEDEEPQIKPMTPEEAQAWRQRHPATSVWRVVISQVLVGLLVSVVAWLVAGEAAAWSAAYGALTVVLPATVFARGLARNSAAAGAGMAMARLFGWEFVKLVLCIAMLAAAPRLVPDLNWLALLAGLVVTMKTYWFAFLMKRSSVRKTD
ncbi:MAG: ATP synthase subunit I [Comamonas sp.]|jgi:ATP synthase protein I|nr:ATP synthase subunit I [Comamonas sp.]